ncbi:unnamed protein product, partial [Allacma fusca]
YGKANIPTTLPLYTVATIKPIRLQKIHVMTQPKKMLIATSTQMSEVNGRKIACTGNSGG